MRPRNKAHKEEAEKEIVKGEVTASNLKDARDIIRKMGLVPTKINEYSDPNLKKSLYSDLRIFVYVVATAATHAVVTLNDLPFKVKAHNA